MTTPFRPPVLSANQKIPSGQSRAPRLTATPAGGRMPAMRRFEVTALAANGHIETHHHIAPAEPLFEEAFSAMARSTIVETANGPRAIEDILPGDMLVTQEFGPQPVLWIGAMTLMPNAPASSGIQPRLIRVLADSDGTGHITCDFLGGSNARILQRPSALRHVAHNQSALLPLRDLVDGFSIFEVTPPSPVRVFHLCLPRHATFNASGTTIESYHPGYDRFDGVGHSSQALYLSLFPHIRTIADFGKLAHPRVSQAALDSLTAA